MAEFEDKSSKVAASLALAGAMFGGELRGAEESVQPEPTPVTAAHIPNLSDTGLPQLSLSENLLDVNVEPERYTIRAGDSLSKIAKTVLQNEKAWELLAEINNLKNPNLIQVGQEILLPTKEQLSEWMEKQEATQEQSYTTYKVKSGDTLSEIAEAQLGSAKEWRSIAAFNELKEPYTIRPGDELKIPLPKKSQNPKGQERKVQHKEDTEGNPSTGQQKEESASLAEKIAQYRPFLVHQRGSAYRESQIKSYSHYKDPITVESDQLCGRSRIWGDVSLETQAQVVSSVIDHLRQEGFSQSEVCYALAVCRVESGFNPDAAAGTTSASGLGQFIDSTREVLCGRAGIENTGPFCMTVNLHCLTESLKESFRFADKRVAAGDTEGRYRLAYAYHHDGPSLKYGGAAIADKKILPRLPVIEKALRSN